MTPESINHGLTEGQNQNFRLTEGQQNQNSRLTEDHQNHHQNSHLHHQNSLGFTPDHQNSRLHNPLGLAAFLATTPPPPSLSAEPPSPASLASSPPLSPLLADHQPPQTLLWDARGGSRNGSLDSAPVVGIAADSATGILYGTTAACCHNHDTPSGAKRPPNDHIPDDSVFPSSASSSSESSYMSSPPKRLRLLSSPIPSSPLGPAYIRRSVSQHPSPSPSAPLGDFSADVVMTNHDNHQYGHLPISQPVSRHFQPAVPPPWSALHDFHNLHDPHDPATPRSAPLLSPSFPFDDVGIVEFLNQDSRPTFIVDLTDKSNFRSGPLQVLFANNALCAEHAIFGSLVSSVYFFDDDAATNSDGFVRFKTWVLSLADGGEGPSELTPPPSSTSCHPSSFMGFQWTCLTLRRRYRVVSGSRNTSNINNINNINFVPADGTARSQIPPARLPDGATPSPTPSTSEVHDYFGSVAMSSVPSVSSVPVPSVPSVPSASASKQPVQKLFDWTRIPLTEDTPEHIRFARSFDWAQTALGPIESWSADLRILSNMLMACPTPVIMYWGPELTAIYNEAYASLAGENHPHLMGSRRLTVWNEFGEEAQPSFRAVWNSGQSISRQDHRIFLKRNGLLEEMFCNWSVIPLVGSDGNVVALLNPVTDCTRRNLNERRMQSLNHLGEKTSEAQTVKRFWNSMRQGLEYNEFDVPFALFYSIAASSDGEDGEASSLPSRSLEDTANTLFPSRVILEGSLGVSPGHAAAVPVLDLCSSDEGFAPYMRQAMTTTPTGSATHMAMPTPIVLSDESGTLPRDLISGLQGERGFGEDCHTVVVFPLYHPIAPASGVDGAASVAGFVVMGTNPRRPFNGQYQLFIHLLARQLTAALASAVLFEEEIRRVARLAAHDQQELSHQLQLRTQQMLDSETKFTRMAESTPVGMFVTDGRGCITYSNDMWWEILQHPPSTNTHDFMLWHSLADRIEDEDRAGLFTAWEHMLHEKTPLAHEFRFSQKTVALASGETSSHSMKSVTWVLLRAYPEKDDQTSELKSIFGCIMDISQQKQAEVFESQRLAEALEHKRQQENFIDITSHEMRNPLSAILQSVDEIIGSVGAFRAGGENGLVSDTAILDDLLESVLDAGNTISLCANHQKRIVEDVLLLSKLDSNLLLVEPMTVQPVAVVRTTLKVAKAELCSHGIHCTVRLLPSYQTLVGVDGFVHMDPSRLGQVITNLLTNAVKVTQASTDRRIVISLGASREGEPVTQTGLVDDAEGLPDGEITYFPRRPDVELLTDSPEWGTGAKLNLHIAVADTGKGMDEEEKAIMFQFFPHNLPRTHTQYGGPELGLFLSRNLIEMQGGQVGVASRKGHGSTLVFYVKCRKVSEEVLASPDGGLLEKPTVALSTPVSPAASLSSLTVFSVGAGDNEKHSAVEDGTDRTEEPGEPREPGEPTADAGSASSPNLKALLQNPPARVSSYPTRTASLPAPPSPGAVAARMAARKAARAAASKGESRSILLPEQLSLTGVPPPFANLPPLDVLIVEDNIVNQRVLQRQLNRCGNRTRLANHGKEALEALRSSRFWRSEGVEDEAGTAMAIDAVSELTLSTTAGDDARDETRANISVILMDLEMPVMDGVTCARAIRDLERSGSLVRHVPIIAVTAYARPEQIEDAKAAGIDDVIAKPFRLAQLMPKILELVKKFQSL